MSVVFRSEIVYKDVRIVKNGNNCFSFFYPQDISIDISFMFDWPFKDVKKHKR
jgi:hypothetical protein